MQKEKTTQEIVAEQMKKLPQDVREFILSVDYGKKLGEISERQKLSAELTEKLEMETSFVLLGLEPISDYVANLEKNLDIFLIQAQEIATDVNENIFRRILQSLQKMDEDMLSVSDISNTLVKNNYMLQKPNSEIVTAIRIKVGGKSIKERLAEIATK
ncbi:MAG: hypothetical protein WCC74_01420 [Minisyncoccia bacterium]